MSALFQFFLFLLTLNNLALLGMGRLRTLINLVTAQGILLGGLLLIHDHALLAVAVLLIKGGLLPWLLHRTRRQIGADPHIKPRLGFGLAVLTGLACLVFSLWLEGRLPMTPGLFPPLLLPAGLTRCSAASCWWWAVPRRSRRSWAIWWPKTASSCWASRS